MSIEIRNTEKPVMGIEIKSVALSPSFFTCMPLSTYMSVQAMSRKSPEYMEMVTRVALAGRSSEVFETIVELSDKITKDNLDRVTEVATCCQYSDEAVCCRLRELLNESTPRKEISLI